MTELLPPSFAPDSRDPLAPRGPWSFLLEAAPGGFAGPGLELLAAWAAFFLLSNVFWAIHLKALTAWSSLPNYWGELLTTRDLWELLENGGLRSHWTGPLVPPAAGLCLVWFLWAGWRLQALSAGQRARLGAWCWGFVDALVIGLPPLLLLGWLLLAAFAGLGSTGIQGLSWLDWVGGALVRLACLSAFFLQWWLCRLGRCGGVRGPGMGGWKPLAEHLGHSFLALWLHPVQWGVLVLGGVLARTGLSFLVLLVAWRLGGGTPVRVASFLLLQVLVVLLNAWLIGWFLRVTARYGRHQAEVRTAIRHLESAPDSGRSCS